MCTVHSNSTYDLIDKLTLFFFFFTRVSIQVGAIVGAFMAKILPDWILSSSLVLLLAVTTYTTLEKGLSLWNKESKTFAEEAKGAIAQVSQDLLCLEACLFESFESILRFLERGFKRAGYISISLYLYTVGILFNAEWWICTALVFFYHILLSLAFLVTSILISIT